MSTDFKLVNVSDSLISDISPEISIACLSGSSSSNFQTFNSQSSSNNNTSVLFNINCPSLSTCLNREVMVQSTIQLKLSFPGGSTEPGYWKPSTSTSADSGEMLFNYAHTNSLQAFPINSLLSTLMSSINNSNVSVSSREVLAPLMKLMNPSELGKFNSKTPSLPDSYYYDFFDSIGSNNNVMADMSVTSFDNKYIARGSFVSELFIINSDGTETILDDLFIRANVDGSSPFSTFYLRTTSIEPLMFLSPYISSHSDDKASFLGINSITVTLTLGNANRCMSNASYATLSNGDFVKTIADVSLVGLSNSKLLLNFLSIPPTMFSKISMKNVNSYNSYQVYSTSSSETVQPGASTIGTFNNIQLSQIPSKMLLYARKLDSQLTTYDSNSFMVINNVNLNFCNKSGLLSSCSQSQLFDISIENSLQMNFYEFSGSMINTSNTSGHSEKIPTIGSILVLNPALNLSLDASLSNLSVGQFNFQGNVSLSNKSREALVGYTLYLLVVNSGLFMTENGISSFQTGLLSQEMVLESKTSPTIIDSHTYNRDIVGGGVENGSLTKMMNLHYKDHTQKEKIHENNGETVNTMSSGSGMSGSGVARRKIHKYI